MAPGACGRGVLGGLGWGAYPDLPGLPPLAWQSAVVQSRLQAQHTGSSSHTRKTDACNGATYLQGAVPPHWHQRRCVVYGVSGFRGSGGSGFRSSGFGGVGVHGGFPGVSVFMGLRVMGLGNETCFQSHWTQFRIPPGSAAVSMCHTKSPPNAQRRCRRVFFLNSLSWSPAWNQPPGF